MNQICAGIFLACVVSIARADILVEVDGSKDVRPISPLIYGSNQPSIPRTCDRLGGNRWTAYNWVNNASNAGNDYQYQSDNYLVKDLDIKQQNTCGAAVLKTLRDNASAGRATILTIPMAGYVSADKSPGGDVRNTGVDYLKTRFKIGKASKPDGHFSLIPNPAERIVYQDEFVNWVNHQINQQQQVIYDLDNEPDLWSSTHAEVHPAKLTYEELCQKTIEYASAVKKVSPHAVVLGAVNFGWSGYRNLDRAPDANGRDFQAYFLQSMRDAEHRQKNRLVDALDFHWYPEASGIGADGKPQRIYGGDNSPGVAAARIQAPRSLWDPTYIETSWITRTQPADDRPIKLFPRTQALIEANDPDMKMAMTEYCYGGGNDISGAIAQADVLGLLGRYGVVIANWWESDEGSQFIAAAMQMYLGNSLTGKPFGNTSVHAAVNDNAQASAYAATDSRHPGEATFIYINKSTDTQNVRFNISNLPAFKSAAVYELNANAAVVDGIARTTHLPDLILKAPNTLTISASPLSVTKFILH